MTTSGLASLRCCHNLLIDALKGFRRNADLSSIRIIQNCDEKNQQTQQARKQYSHPEVHAETSGMKKPANYNANYCSR